MSGPNPEVLRYVSQKPVGRKAGRQLELFLVDYTRDEKGNVIALFHGEVASIEVDGPSEPDVQKTFNEFLTEELEWQSRLAWAEENSDELAEDSNQR